MINRLTGTLRMYQDVFGFWPGIQAMASLVTRRSRSFVVDSNYGFNGVSLRVPSSDILVFREVVSRREYDAEFVSAPRTIIDAGANIGLTSVYLAKQFPNAKIIAIEPQKDNFDCLVKNTTQYPNVICLHAALWCENTTLALDDRGSGAWGFGTRTLEQIGASTDARTDAVCIPEVMRRFGITRIDFLKMDIEGAEKEVLLRSEEWIGSVDVLAIELHERFCKGVTRAFYAATNGFGEESSRGETMWVARCGKLKCMPS